MHNQRHLFQLPDNEYYLNCAYMSPLLRSVEAAGAQGLVAKRNPFSISPANFFNEAEQTRSLFAQLISAAAGQVVIIPSVAYAMANALHNIMPKKGGHALIVADEFPSDYLSAERWSRQHGGIALKTIKPEEAKPGRGHQWNTRIVEAINPNTTFVLISHTHWVDGTLFDLRKIGQRCKEVGALLLVDGTQSVGALPLDVNAFNIDVLVCAGYKWLLGPYSIGLAYYSPYFNQGQPIEESWMNRDNARDFRSLTNYGTTYLPGAARYQVGEYSNFILLPMLTKALEQVLEWQPTNIQAYCTTLTQPLLVYLQQNGFWLEEEHYRAGHMFGFGLPYAYSEEHFNHELEKRNIRLSVRGNKVRVAPHVYNTEQDINALLEALEACKP